MHDKNRRSLTYSVHYYNIEISASKNTVEILESMNDIKTYN